MFTTADLDNSCARCGPNSGLQLPQPSASLQCLATCLVNIRSKHTMYFCNLSILGRAAFSALMGKGISVFLELGLQKWLQL